ncbi:uncharacterized protein F4822DRAFT_204617 [Hypoxylon trugodes]|uniref:uncharacterized protein n=1 Tax=Hypoxylon trugodes TaxID=326681 RepID=UPI00219F030D|nr:uncharacterized protein F4822DRAFT_204617 [Hypoxylon trugodes]KAI1389551.1 hypothetical protein F4822DRAFT_204617 [Hypoxylon trugodes]
MVVRCKEVFAFGAATLAATFVGAAPVDYFPINSQLPPVARISEAFEFTFSPITFFSSSNITYRLENAPKWLSIDSDSRRLFGTPSDDDVPFGEVVGIPIELVAEDETGSTTANPTLVVSRNPPPIIAIPASKQIPKFGTYIAPSSLHLHPSKPFSFSFDEHTFRTESGDGGLNYYAVSGDNVPLPSWITFDAKSLSFSGKTPPFESLVQPPQTFTFQLVASDVVGFASISLSFSLVVGNHELTADPPVVKLNATHKKPFEYKDLHDVVQIDKKDPKPDDISTIEALDLPSWLSFDNKTWELKGTPDETAESSNITVAVTDKYSDTLNLTISIHFGLFISDLPDLNLKEGDDFSFDLKKYLSNPSDIEVTLEGELEASWTEFNSSSMILSGTVPKLDSAKSATAPRVAFNASSKHTNETEVKSMNIHVSTPNSKSPKPSGEPTDSDSEDSKKNLLWLLIIPIFLVFIAITLFLFYIRRRRQQPRRPQVSGPIPGSFIANRPDNRPKNSDQNIKGFVDIGVRRSDSTSAQDSRASALVSSQQSVQSSSSLSVNGNGVPHAMMAMYSRAKSPEHSVIFETRSSWSAGKRSQASPHGTGRTDEISLLSDTSLGEGDVHIAEAQSYTITRRTQDTFRGLDVPMSSEPFSIQNTPEIAYRGDRRYDSGSDEAVPPPVGYAVRPKSGQQEEPGFSLRGVSKRISNLWKRESVNQTIEEQKRNSMRSNSTTRTSILTSGVSGVGEEEATTSTNVVARPTIIHIPSRPGEVRQVSRRVSEFSPLFGGRPLTKSPRNFGLTAQPSDPALDETPEQPPNLDDSINPRDSDTSWDRLARNSLGIAYKDLITEPEKTLPPSNITQEDNWIIHGRNDLLSPDRWPQLNTSVNMVGIARTSPYDTSSELPRLPPTTALVTSKGNGKGMGRRPSRASKINLLHNTPSTSSRSDGSYVSRDEVLQNSYIHRQRMLGEMRALASQTPSPETGWEAPDRPLPETPTRPGRTPLASRSNESYYPPVGGGGQGSGIENVPSKNWKATRSMKSAKSLRSVWADEDDDEDAWEDIRPPTTIDGWDDGGVDSNESFAVYI